MAKVSLMAMVSSRKVSLKARVRLREQKHSDDKGHSDGQNHLDDKGQPDGQGYTDCQDQFKTISQVQF
jgi:hypothetical protein